MKRELLKLLIVIAAAVGLAAGVDHYLVSNDKTVLELAQDLKEAAVSLVTSEDAQEEGDTSVVSADLEESAEESQTGSKDEAGAETSTLESADTTGSQAETEQISGSGEGEETPLDGEEAPPDTAAALTDGSQPPDIGDGRRPSDGNRDTDWKGVFTDEYQIENFEIIYQMPELPTGCEVVALTMVLHYYGFDVDKTTMAADYLPTAEAIFYYGSDGLKYGPDLNEYFVGNPFTEGGYICGTGAIVTAADSYLSDVGSDLRAVDMTGTSVEELYRLVSEDIPVLVWVTIEMAQRASTSGWYTESGEYVEWSTNDHGAVLIGYTEDTVTIADPISGLIEYSREAFESVFASRGNQCVILQ
ncbi:MAG: C39 family peptidase [Lachnospiraceae bacterium]|nr:C39 family peptidase [Lachnospiraceae bacterium]